MVEKRARLYRMAAGEGTSGSSGTIIIPHGIGVKRCHIKLHARAIQMAPMAH